MRSLGYYSNLNRHDKLDIVCNTGVDWFGVYFDSQTELHLKVHDYVEDVFIQISKNEIAELYNVTKMQTIPLYPLTRNVPNTKHRTFSFLNEEHELNYDKLLTKWPAGANDKEYAAAIYITALPLIFNKVATNFEQFASPITWIADYEYKHNDTTAEAYDISEVERDAIEIDYELTSPMIQLGRLAYHLWTGYEQFNLLDCILSLDDTHYYAATQAIEIRR